MLKLPCESLLYEKYSVKFIQVCQVIIAYCSVNWHQNRNILSQKYQLPKDIKGFILSHVSPLKALLHRKHFS